MSNSRKKKTKKTSGDYSRKKVDFTFVLDGLLRDGILNTLGDKLGRVAASNKFTLREILHLYFSETVYYGRMSCRCAMAACPLRMPIPCLMPVRQRGPVRPASPECRSRVDPSALRSRAGTTPPFATHADIFFFFILL